VGARGVIHQHSPFVNDEFASMTPAPARKFRNFSRDSLTAFQMVSFVVCQLSDGCKVSLEFLLHTTTTLLKNTYLPTFNNIKKSPAAAPINKINTQYNDNGACLPG
jgi:hypothetical protein